jgi:hypothetical protein
MVHEIVSTIFSFKFEEELDVFREYEFGIREKIFNILDPTTEIFHGVWAIQVGLSDDTQGAFAEKVQLAFGADPYSPPGTQIAWP